MSDFLTLSGHTQLVGVCGWPVEHSLSPAMHNAAFRALGLDWRYLAFPVPPERLGEAVAGLRALGLKGANFTVPHKEALLRWVDELTPAARAIGAANTLSVAADGRLSAHNTDAAGFLRALGEAGFDPAGCRAVVLGAGGAARAVVYALAGAGAQLTLLNRTPERAVQLAREFAGVNARATLVGAALEEEALRQAARVANLVVNTTTLGMWPRVETTPWPDALPFPRQALLYDLVYTPRPTQLMTQARAGGATAVDGLGMLVHQGAEAFTLWTGTEAPMAVMRAAAETALAARVQSSSATPRRA
jgi:shikimate dehydrogenase